MSDSNKTVFISYRRSTGQHLARSIFMDLRANGWDAFFDVNTIDSGMFDLIILNQIAARAHFVLVLSKGALQRCVNEGDWLRREIEEAIRLKRNIVLVTAEGFDFKRETKYLPESLKDLPRYTALPLVHFYFDSGMEILRERFLKEPFYGDIVPASNREASIVQQRIDEAAQTPEAQMSAVDYLNRGLARYNKHDLEGAIADYNEALRLNPQLASAYNNRGTARYDKHDYDGAIADYSEAIRLNPQYALAYNNRGSAWKSKNDLDGAMADFNEAIRLNPQYADAYYSRGVARHVKRDPGGAIADYNEAIRLNPLHANAYYNRGGKRKEKGDLDGAIADFQKYLDLGGGQRDGDQQQVEGWIRDLKQKLAK